MDELQEDHTKLPPKLYRVQHPRSRVRHTPAKGLHAANWTSEYDRDELAIAFAKAFRGWYDEPSAFIFVFDSRPAADKWKARMAKEEPTGTYELFTLDTAKFPKTTRVYSLAYLAKELDIDLVEVGVQQGLKGGYGILHHLPAEGIEKVEEMAGEFTDTQPATS